MALFVAPELDEADQRVIAMIHDRQRELRPWVAVPHRWTGLLRRVMLSQAIRGSNTIEGFTVSEDDAFAALDEQAPIDADQTAWQAVLGYRNAMTYVLQLAEDRTFRLSVDTLRALHFMMQRYDLTKWPGRWRPGDVFVHDDARKRVVYQAPDAELVPDLLAELVNGINAESAQTPVLVRAAMAHLNLVMIHPFKDGNGRMGRCLQTLLLACGGISAAPEFASIEEYLGMHQHDYYEVLAEVGGGSWNPGRDARPWVRFCLTAHYRQTQEVIRSGRLASDFWMLAEDEVRRAGLPVRAVQPLAFALTGRALRNSTYRQLTEDLSTVVAGRDLTRMANAGLLVFRGERRGRIYAVSPRLRDATESITARVDKEYAVDGDPYLVSRT